MPWSDLILNSRPSSCKTSPFTLELPPAVLHCRGKKGIILKPSNSEIVLIHNQFPLSHNAQAIIRDAVNLPTPALMTPDEEVHYLMEKTIHEYKALQRNGATDYQASTQRDYSYYWDGYGCPSDFSRVKPSAYDTSTTLNQLRESLDGMLGAHEARNVALKLFKGIRPKHELPGEETERQFTKVHSKNNLKKTVVGDHVFHSRKDYTTYCAAIMGSYDDYEIVGGRNEEFVREVMHKGGYVDRAYPGKLFFATFKRRNSERVLCFMGDDNVPTAEFLDAVVRRVPSTPIPASEVPVQVVNNPTLETAISDQMARLNWEANHNAIAKFGQYQAYVQYASYTAGIEHEVAEIAKFMNLAA